MKTKRILSVLITVVMLIGMLPTAVFAEDTTYDLWVGGVQVTDANKDNVDGNNKVSYDPATKTLTLNGYSYTGEGYEYDSNSACAAIYFNPADENAELTIELVGTNTVIIDNSECTSDAIYIANGNLIIEGNGSLTATGDTGIYAWGNISISGENTSVIATGNYGIQTNGGDIDIDGSKVEANGGYEGIVAYGNIDINGGEVKATATYEYGIGIYADGNIDINGGKVEANGGYEGIVAYGNIDINGDKVDATGSLDYGIYADGTLTINGGIVTATGANGIYADGNITVSGGKVEATANDEYGIGIVANAVTVNGGTVEVISTGEYGYGITTRDGISCNGDFDVYAGETAPGELVTSPITSTYNSKYVKIVPVLPHEHCICGATHTSVGDHTAEDEKTFDAISTYDGLVAAAATGGSVYLTGDITLEAPLTVSQNLSLCLNGYDLIYNDADSVIVVSNSKTLNITDCGSTGTITGSTGDYGAVQNGTGTFNLYAGNIVANKRGVYNGGTFSMYGGNIAGNSDDGVWNISTFTMYGGEISGNTGDGVHSTGTVTMYDGEITGNSGDGVYTTLTFTMNGGEISGNTGDGVYTLDDFTMNGGKITGNDRGVMYEDGTASVSGAPVIKDNANGNFCDYQGGYYLTVSGALTDGAYIGVTLEETFGEAAGPSLYDSTLPAASNYIEYFYSDKGYGIYAEGDSIFVGNYITEQPNAENNYTIKTNDDANANFQWGTVTVEPFTVVEDEDTAGGAAGNRVEITDKWGGIFNANGTWTTEEFVLDIEIPVQKGDVVKFTPVGDVSEVEIAVSVYYGPEFEYDEESGSYTYAITEDVNYINPVASVYIQEEVGPIAEAEDQVTFMVEVVRTVFEPLDNQTEATLDTGNLPTGNYACQITWDYLNTPDDTSDDYILQSVVVEYIVPQYTVSFDANGGSGEMGDQEIRKGEATALYENTFTRTGYTFAGWATSSNGAKVHDDKQLVTDIAGADETITLYAVWTADTNTAYTVRYFTQTLDAAKAGNAEENDTNYTLADSKTYYGTSDDSVWAERIDIEGFKKPAGKMITISPDGTTVYDYYYERNKYNIHINDIDGVSSVSGAGAYFFEEEVTISATVEAGYKWIGWGGSFTASEQTYTFIMSSSGSITLTPQLEEKATVVIDETTQFADYDKTAKTFSIISNDSLEGFTITYKQNEQNVTPVNAGFYDVVLSRAEDENYKAYSKTLTNGLIINKIVVDEPNVGDKPYNGSMQTADIAGTEIYEVTENAGGKDVGAYDVILTLKDTANYKWKLAENSSATATRKFYITFTENTWEEEPQITGWTYGQSPNAPIFDAKFGEVSVEYKKTSEDESKYTTNAPENAGNYNVRLTVSATTNFGGLSKVIDLNISKATPSLESPTAQNSITYGAKLNTVGLPTGWSWIDGDTTPTVVNSGYSAYYTPADTNNYDWTAIDGWNETKSRVERTVDVTVGKGTPEYIVPTGLNATYGDTLENVTLPTGWSWKDATTTSVGNAGTKTFAAVFTPDDTDNYNTVEADLEVNVVRQKVAKPAENTTVFTYNGNEQIYTLTENARYEITNNKRTDAGEQTVAITLKDSANYEWTDGSVSDVEYTFTIGKATAEITVDTTPIVKTYGEAFTLPTATSTFGTPLCDKTVAQMSNVGSYEVTYSVAETLNYFGDAETVSVTINPAMVSKPTADNTEFVYNGSMQTYSVPSNSNYTVSGNARTDAGEQTVTVTLNDKHNYRWDDNTTDDVTFTFTIAQKEIGIVWGTTQFTYNKTEQKPTATATGLVTGDSCEIAVTGGQTNAGNGYVATAESLSNANYKLPTSKTTTFNIAQKSVAITGITIEATKVYDRETNAVITNYGIVSNVIDGDIVTVNTASATATYNDANVGNGKAVAFAGFAITGADAENYALSSQPESQSANITPKPVTITGATVTATKVYDANTTASIESTGSVAGVISGDAVDVNSSSATAVYSDANIGTDKTITFAGFAISGADASNYELSAQPANTTANITAKDIAGAVITLGESLTYNGNEQTQTIASATVDGLTITYEVSGNVNTNAGDYTLTITGNENFTGTAQKAYTIAKRDATLETVPSAITPLTYNAAEQTLVSAGENVVGGTLMYKLGDGEYSAELPKATNAGSYTVYYKVIGDSNHNDTEEQNFEVTISQKVVSPAIVLTTPVPNQTPVTNIETDEYTATIAWSPDVTDKFAYSTDYTATITITPKDNYTLTGVTENGYTIEGATVTNPADSGVITAVFPKTSSRPSSGGGTTRYTVKFDTDGGSEIASKTVTRNSKVAEPTAPEKEGYTFMGWFTDESLTVAYDFDSKVTKNFTLYAKWEKVDDELEDTDTHNCPSKAFDDIDVNAWYHEDTDYVIENGIFKGIGETTFAPNDKLTRAMLVTVLYRMENEPATNRSIPFSDVDMGAYYANAVSWAKQNGIVNGVNETEFAPNDNITREQIAAIMMRYAVYKGMDAITLEENLHFADADEISEYAVSSMNWAVGTGLINGKSESTLAPKDNATRIEVAAILHRFIKANLISTQN